MVMGGLVEDVATNKRGLKHGCVNIIDGPAKIEDSEALEDKSTYYYIFDANGKRVCSIVTQLLSWVKPASNMAEC